MNFTINDILIRVEKSIDSVSSFTKTIFYVTIKEDHFYYIKIDGNNLKIDTRLNHVPDCKTEIKDCFHYLNDMDPDVRLKYLNNLERSLRSINKFNM